MRKKLFEFAENSENSSLVFEIREKHTIKKTWGQTNSWRVNGARNVNVARNVHVVSNLRQRVQEIFFNEEIYALRKNLELPLTSELRPFKPFLDEVEQLRVGGRIFHAPVDY